MKNPLPTIARAIPLIAGPALMLIPTDQAQQFEYARRFTFFILFFAFVGAVKFLLMRLFGGASKQTSMIAEERVGKYLKRPLLHRGREVFDILLLLVCTFLMLASMQAYRSASPAEIFPFVVLAILAGAIESRLTTLARWPLGTAIVAFVGGSVVSLLSLVLPLQQVVWQSILIALAFGTVGGASSLASSIERAESAEPTQRKRLARALIITLALAPLSIGALVQLREFEPAYLLTFLVIPALSALFRELRTYEESGAIPRRLRVSVAAASLLFVVIVWGVSVVYRS